MKAIAKEIWTKHTLTEKADKITLEVQINTK